MTDLLIDSNSFNDFGNWLLAFIGFCEAKTLTEAGLDFECLYEEEKNT